MPRESMRKYLALLLACGGVLQAATQQSLEVAGGLNQPVEHWQFANDAARTGATGFFSQDIGKLGFQTDSGIYYRLTGITPSWSMVGAQWGTTVATVGDADFTFGSGQHLLLLNGTPYSGSHSIHLPNSSAAGQGYLISIQDTNGSLISGVRQANINAANGTDTFWPGNGTSWTWTGNGSNVTFMADGVSRWICIGNFPAAVAAAGRFAQENVTSGSVSWDQSPYTLPTSIGTSGKVIQSNGSNTVFSSPVFPTTISNLGYYPRSDGNTGYLTYEGPLYASSTASVSASYASDTYIAGSLITVTPNVLGAGYQYHCTFDMTKTAAGTGAIVLTLRFGLNGTTADAAIVSHTYAAGTAAGDSGIFEVWVTIRTSGTSGVVQLTTELRKQGTSTGLVNSGTDLVIGNDTSGTVNIANGQTKLGLSFNGGASFSGSNNFVQTQYFPP